MQEIGADPRRPAQARQRSSLLVVEQNLDLVLDVADRIVVVERGRIERESSTARGCGGGQLAELLGMGAARSARGAPRPRARAAAASRAASTRRPPAAPAAAAAAPTRLRHDTAPAAASRPAGTAPHFSRGDTMSTVKRPTLEQMSEIVASLHMSMSEHEIGEYLEVLEGHDAGLRPRRRSCPTTCRRCAIRARPAIGRAPPRTRSTPGP